MGEKVYFIEEPCFNNFLEMFEDEELKEERCAVCQNTVVCRESIEADVYICSNCALEAVVITHNFL